MTYEELKPIFIKFASHLRGSKIFKDDEPFMCKSDFHHFLCEIQNEKLTPS